MYSVKEIAAGDVLITEGTIQPNIFILKSGKLVVMKSNGRDVKTIGEISPGAFIGEMAYLGKQKMHQATVIAVENSEVIEIHGDSFLQTLTENPVWLKALLRTLVTRLEEQNEKKIAN